MPDVNRFSDQELERILDAPIYSTAEASRLVGLSKSRVRRWFSGYEYSYKTRSGKYFHEVSQDPVIQREATEGTTYVSFLDLIGLLFVSQFLDDGHSLQKVRKALDEAVRILGTRHFAKEIFFTDGSGIYLQVKKEGDAIMQLLTGGQWVIAPIITGLAKRIDFHSATGWARRWYPLGRDKLIVIDPLISFGRPSIKGRGIATLNIFDFYLGEDKNLKNVCRWMNLTELEAEAAIGFELQLAA